MTPAGFDRLAPEATKVFLGFLSAPANTLHEDWQRELIPDWVVGSTMAKDASSLSASLLMSLELTEDLSALHFENVIHQAALMPPAALADLARAVGVGLASADFRRAVDRETAAMLDQALTEQDWRMLFALPQTKWPEAPLDPQALSSQSAQFETSGLHCLCGIFRQEPRNIGQRALLKLPKVVSSLDPALLSNALAIFPVIYRLFVSDWHPSWPQLWAAASSETVH